jgi:hypothetical protein
VKLGGDLDTEPRPELDDAVDCLTVAAPERVDVDVAAVTRAGALLPTFLTRLRKAIPARSMLTVSRPSPWASLVLRATDRAEIARIDDPVPHELVVRQRTSHYPGQQPTADQPS